MNTGNIKFAGKLLKGNTIGAKLLCERDQLLCGDTRQIFVVCQLFYQDVLSSYIPCKIRKVPYVSAEMVT